MISLEPDSIAIVGMSGRFPGATNVETFWSNTLEGESFIHRQLGTSGEVQWARGKLSDIAAFDPSFFRMSPRDALVMDPQHRLLLECAWEAIADATPPNRSPIARTAVYAGTNYSGYRQLLEQGNPGVSAVELESGIDKDFLATTISYRLGLSGPSVTVQTACSSSLVAVHMAVRSLIDYEADQAIAGGVSIVLPHAAGWRYEIKGIHSTDGFCRPFDESANGTVMGDGAGLVVLRRLSDAIDDGCHIYAVLKGSAVNNDGPRKLGFAAPSLHGQIEVIRSALARSGLNPADIGYIETHGTGTALGDQIEFRALREVFSDDSWSGRCALGSAKGAVGHLDVAAGVTGLIRALLAIEHRRIPGTAHHTTPHRKLEIEQTPFYIPRTATDWPNDGVRRAGISSFGVGGTNAHVVIEEFLGNTPSRSTRTTLASNGYAPSRYWPAQPSSPAVPAQPTGEPSAVEYVRETWTEWIGHPSHDQTHYGKTILLGDPGQTNETLYQLLIEHGHNIATAFEYEPPSGQIDMPLQAHYASSLASYINRGSSDRTLLICTWALKPGETAQRTYDLLTAIGRVAAQLKDGLDVVLVCQGAYSISGAENGDPALGTLTGLARVLTTEYLTIRVRVVDVHSVDITTIGKTIEVIGKWADEPLLVYRGRRWWRPSYETIAPPAPSRTPSRPLVSVIFGAGQIGESVARVLAKRGGTIILAVRPGDGAKHALAIKQKLDAHGSIVTVEHCDVSQPHEVDALISALMLRYQRVDQLVLAAGLSGEKAYQATADLPAFDNEAHFLVKVSGVAALAAAAERHRVPRTVLMSSLAGVLGAMSLGPYSAASSALDICADRNNQRSGGWLSIGWDAWKYDPVRASALEARMVQKGLTSREAEQALAALLYSECTGHILVVKGSFAARWDQYVRQPMRLAASAAHRSLTRSHPNSSALLAEVLDAWRHCLGNPRLAPDDDLLQHGADSLSSVDVLGTLSANLGLALPADAVFEHPTVRLLAEHISASLTSSAAAGPNYTLRRWGDAGPVIWCLHPIGGSAEAFKELAATLPDFQFLAVAGQPLADVTEAESVEQQALRYCRVLAESNTQPAVLIGWSYGAILAFELARLISVQRGCTPTVVLLDMPAPQANRSRSINDVSDTEITLAIASHRNRELDGTTIEPAAFISLALSDALEALHAQDAVAPGLTADIAQRMAAGYRKRLGAVEEFHPAPYDGGVILIRASEREFADSTLLAGVLEPPEDDPSWGWAVLSRSCDVHVIDGHHATLLTAPASREIARIIKNAAQLTTENRQ